MNASIAQPRQIEVEADRIAPAAPSPAPRTYRRAWRALVLFGDVCAIAIAFAAAIALVWRVFGAHPGFGACAVAATLLLVAFAVRDLHERTYAILRRDEIYYALAVTLLTAAVIVPAFLLTDISVRSRIAVVVGIALAGVTLSTVRYAMRRMVGEQQLFVEPRTIVVGGAGDARNAATSIKHDPRARAEIVPPPPEHDPEPWLNDLCKASAPTHIVIAEDLPGMQLNALARAAERRGIVLAVAAQRYASALAVGELVLGDATFLKVGVPHVGSVWARRVKRLFDITVAVLALALALPVLTLAAAAIAVESGLPIFYRQIRVGRDGQTFQIFKLRSMRHDAERNSGPVWAVNGDARVTRVGRLLRRTSLDELPQLFNVLFGEMSIVGPRPERPVFVERFAQSMPSYRERFMVAPGLTACSHLYMPRDVSNASIGERLDYDLFYIRHWSLAMDVALVMKTAAEVVFHRAA